jgi:hypothetical protein
LEARLIKENKVRPTLLGLTPDTGPLLCLPSLHLLVVAFASLAAGLLAGPTQASFEDLADMLGVEGNAQAFAEQAGDAVSGPQIVGPAVFLGPLAEKSFELAQAVVGQMRRAARNGFGIQPMRFLGHASPAMKGGGADAEDTGDHGRGFALLDECDSAATAAFEFSRCSFGSHDLLYVRPVKTGIFLSAGFNSFNIVTRAIAYGEL